MKNSQNYMSWKSLACALFLIALIGSFVHYSPEKSNAPFQEDTHYKLLKGMDQTNSKQVVLFFSPTCPHCYAFHKEMKIWESTMDNNIVYERIPVTFGKPEWATISKMYSVSRILNIQDAVLDKLFSDLQEKGLWWPTKSAIFKWFNSQGYNEATIEEVWDSKETNQLLLRYINSEGTFAVRSIPRLIINGKYELHINEFAKEGNEDKLSAAINYLLAL
jgi:thiol-disulfide isomerase/thioredoxin